LALAVRPAEAARRSIHLDLGMHFAGDKGCVVASSSALARLSASTSVSRRRPLTPHAGSELTTTFSQSLAKQPTNCSHIGLERPRLARHFSGRGSWYLRGWDLSTCFACRVTICSVPTTYSSSAESRGSNLRAQVVGCTCEHGYAPSPCSIRSQLSGD
jgi:hypothetical protein